MMYVLNRIRSIVIICFLFAFLIACKKDKKEVIPEAFEESNKPFFEQNIEDDSYLLKPWNYELSYNSKRNYPLLVYLHGRGYTGGPFSFIGYQNDDFKKEYPCFVYMPHSDGQWNVDLLISKIDKVKSQYRINNSRIYLIGYSMGAYWAAPLANKLEDDGIFFAGIISQAGLSNHSDYEAEVLDKTSLWIHVGELDGNYTRSQERFADIKNYLTSKGASSNTSDITIESYNTYNGRTETLTLNGSEVMKNTVYFDVGHGVSHFPFSNPGLMQWLFSQNVE